MLKRTNIEDKLKKSKAKAFKGSDILDQVTAILKEEDRKEDEIMARMKSPQKPTPRNHFNVFIT
jgi:hypothetical protein